MSSDNMIVNVGNPIELTVEDLAKLVKSVTGSTSQIRYLELPPERVGDPRRRKPDISRAKQILDWQPVVGIEEGLNKYFSTLAK